MVHSVITMQMVAHALQGHRAGALAERQQDAEREDGQLAEQPPKAGLRSCPPALSAASGIQHTHNNIHALCRLHPDAEACRSAQIRLYVCSGLGPADVRGPCSYLSQSSNVGGCTCRPFRRWAPRTT